MQFVVNDQLVSERDTRPDLTLLNYLRETLKLAGTKEGCASGDCGACTVLVGELKDKTVHYQTVNACIAPLAMAAGKHIVTVEHLERHGQLHPAQTAMVAQHGSQCGFCTPGFVMSMAGLYQGVRQHSPQPSGNVSRLEVYDAISGNLCRCTGYRPIVDAALSMFDPAQEQSNQAAAHDSLYDDNIVAMLEKIDFRVDRNGYFAPRNLAELFRVLSKYPDAKIIAGGTDLALEITQKYASMDTLVDVTQVAELTQWKVHNRVFTIGAAVTYSELERASAQHFPQLVGLLARLGSRQIRNRGTLGGNLGNASPIADIPPVIMALDGWITVGSAESDAREYRLDEFYTGYRQTQLKPGDCIISVHIPVANIEQFHRFYKVSKRIEDDISAVMAAVQFEHRDGVIDAARVAFGGMAATPVRVAAAEAAFKGQPLASDAALSEATSALRRELKPMSDVRASAQYRLDVAVNLLRKAWLEAQGETLPRITDYTENAHA